MNCKGCEFSITDIIDVDEGIEVMLLCSFHDCLPDDIPEKCDVEEYMNSYYDDLFDSIDHGEFKLVDDVVPF